MKKWIGIGIGLTLLLGVGGVFGYFATRRHEVRITESKLKASLEEKMPYEKTYFKIVNVQLDGARVDLENGNDRIRVGIDATLSLKGKRKRKLLTGTLDLTSGIKYVGDERAFYLTEPVIDTVMIEGVPEKMEGLVKKALQKAVSEYFSIRPIYRLKASDAKSTVAKLLIKDFRIEDGELVVVLGLF